MSVAVLRPITQRDVAEIAALARDLREWFSADVPDQIRADCARCEGLVAATSEGRLVAFLLWFRDGDIWEIKWLAVARKSHRQGIGALLMSRLVEIARTSVNRRAIMTHLEG